MVKSRVSDEEYNRTISIKGVNIQDYMRNYKPRLTQKHKGVNIAYYQTAGNPSSNYDKEAQAVINFLTSNMHIDESNNATRENIDKAIDDAFSKVIQSDKVRSAKEYYKVNSKTNPTGKRYIVDIPLSKLEDTAYDSYIHRATRLQNSQKDEMYKMARVWGNSET